MLSLVPTLKFHMHDKLYSLYTCIVPEGGLFQIRMLHACVAQSELR